MLDSFTPEDKVFRFQETRTIKRCPKCTSVFIETTFCESCGFQFDYIECSDSLGSKGLYSVRDRYRREISFFGLSHSLFIKRGGQIDRKYKRFLWWRFDLLLKKITSDNFLGESSDLLFEQEFSDLIDELLAGNHSRQKIYDRWKEKSGDLLLEEIILLKLCEYERKIDLRASFFETPFLKFLTIKFICKLLLSFSFIIFLSLYFFQYYFKEFTL